MQIQQYEYMDKCLTHGMFVDVESDRGWRTVIPMKDLYGYWREGSWEVTREEAKANAGDYDGATKADWLEREITQISPYFVGEPYKKGDEVMCAGNKFIIDGVNCDGTYELEGMFCCDMGHTVIQPAPPTEETITIEGNTYNKTDVVERLKELKEIK